MQDPGVSPSPKLPKRRFQGFAAFAALAALLCTGASSPSGCNSSQFNIGPSKGEVVGAVAGVSAVAVVAVLVAENHSRHTLKGCLVSGQNGLELRTSDQRYQLAGDVLKLNPGDRVRVHGSHLKKTAEPAGQNVFTVESLQKNYGPCR